MRLVSGGSLLVKMRSTEADLSLMAIGVTSATPMSNASLDVFFQPSPCASVSKADAVPLPKSVFS